MTEATREGIERLRRSEAEIFERGGTRSAAQTGEEYRQELRKALATRREEIEAIPWKAGSGIRRGDRAGHAFAAKVDDRTYLRFVPLEAEQPVEVEEGVVLRLVEALPETPTVLSDEMRRLAFPAWERARRSIFDAWMAETDPANLQPRLRPINRQIAVQLRETPPSSVDEVGLAQLLDAVESPWSRRDPCARCSSRPIGRLRIGQMLWPKRYVDLASSRSGLLNRCLRSTMTRFDWWRGWPSRRSDGAERALARDPQALEHEEALLQRAGYQTGGSTIH